MVCTRCSLQSVVLALLQTLWSLAPPSQTRGASDARPVDGVTAAIDRLKRAREWPRVPAAHPRRRPPVISSEHGDAATCTPSARASLIFHDHDTSAGLRRHRDGLRPPAAGWISTPETAEIARARLLRQARPRRTGRAAPSHDIGPFSRTRHTASSTHTPAAMRVGVSRRAVYVVGEAAGRVVVLPARTEVWARRVGVGDEVGPFTPATSAAAAARSAAAAAAATLSTSMVRYSPAAWACTCAPWATRTTAPVASTVTVMAMAAASLASQSGWQSAIDAFGRRLEHARVATARAEKRDDGGGAHRRRRRVRTSCGTCSGIRRCAEVHEGREGRPELSPVATGARPRLERRRAIVLFVETARLRSRRRVRHRWRRLRVLREVVGPRQTTLVDRDGFIHVPESASRAGRDGRTRRAGA